MARLPSKVHLTSHPIQLMILGPSVYEDEKKRMWLHLAMETGGVVQVRLRRENLPSGHTALTTCPQTSSTMPLMWTLYPGSQYVDFMGRFWRIVHHIKEDGVEEMMLEKKDNSEGM
ncbi:T-cell leukemia/lymphoma protein 1A-like [Myotis yumanensis]|uniref:T-cell leukemia/lymphoma protein 1A-like n=1 Tax=Myotis yumanensis TaxID=159337 RepID=UPI0038D45940